MLKRQESLRAPTVDRRLEPNKEFLRELLATQIDLTTHERFEKMQAEINRDGVPSEEVIDMHRAEFGTDYRVETEGQHPMESLRQTVEV